MTKDMTTGNPLRLILLFTLPVLIGNLFQQFYNMVDAIIVGQFLGEDALAAVGATGSIVFFILGFAMGIAQGFGVMVSQAFGAKDIPRLKHYVGVSLILGVVISAVLTVLTVAFSRDFLMLLNTPDNILAMSDSYLRIIFLGTVCNMFYNIASGILRGVGDSKTPLYFLILSSVINIILDLFFIVTLKWNVAGAAYATIIAQGISALLCFVYMFRKFEILQIKRTDCHCDKDTVKKLIGMGIPMALNYSLTAIGIMILQAAVNVFGSAGIAAYTAASKVEQIATQVLPSLGTTMATYCGQNLGAGKFKRIYDGMRSAFFVGIAFTVSASLICAGLGRYIVYLFLSEPTDTVLTYATQYLNTISVFFLFLMFIFLYRMALQGLGKGLMPLLSGIFEMVCRIATVILLLKPYGYWCVRLASPVAWIGAGIPLMAAYLVWKNHSMQANITLP